MIAFAKEWIAGAGMSYVIPAETALRMSKSEDPRLEFAPTCLMNRDEYEKVLSEAVSME
jgi:hypothetical protein